MVEVHKFKVDEFLHPSGLKEPVLNPRGNGIDIKS